MGYAFERVIVRPVYGSHLKQILVTMGGLIVVQQLIHVIWGPAEIYLARPQTPARRVHLRRGRDRALPHRRRC
jgi:branched-chain amino acid transport system permease protein